MINIFYRVADDRELMHCRTVIATVHDADQAATLLQTLQESGTPAGGAPARQRGTVAALVARRDAALDREMAARMVARRRAALRPVAG